MISGDGVEAGTIPASEKIFGREYNEDLVHQLVVAYQANARFGTRKQKNRREVRHSTVKPFRQKGTGRARAGMRSSPLWRGGGRIFPNTPDENFSQKINRKMYRAGIATILSQLVRSQRLFVVENFVIDAPKTKLMAEKMRELQVTSMLLITDDLNDNLYLAARNLPNVQVVEPRQADPLSLIHYDRVLLTRGAVAKLEEMYA